MRFPAAEMQRFCVVFMMTVILSTGREGLGPSGRTLFVDAVHSYEDSEGQSYFYKSIDPEDFLLGIIVPVHSQPNLTEVNPLRCGDVLEQVRNELRNQRFSSPKKNNTYKRITTNKSIQLQEGIQRVEMALRTVSEINERRDLLPNTTLGIHIRDSCNYPPIALEQTINYIRASVWHDSDYQETPYPWSQSHSIETYSLKKCTVPEKRRNLVSVLGPATCTGTTQVMLRLEERKIYLIDDRNSDNDNNDELYCTGAKSAAVVRHSTNRLFGDGENSVRIFEILPIRNSQ